MTKRARGTVRPGQRPPIQRRAPGSSEPVAQAAGTPVAPRPGGLTAAEEARAAELEARLLAEEKAAEAARTKARAPRVDREPAVAGSLAVAAQREYAYVARDVKDIVRIASLLFGVLLVLWLLIDVMAVFG
jgi:hypothetical protein